MQNLTIVTLLLILLCSSTALADDVPEPIAKVKVIARNLREVKKVSADWPEHYIRLELNMRERAHEELQKGLKQTKAKLKKARPIDRPAIQDQVAVFNQLIASSKDAMTDPIPGRRFLLLTGKPVDVGAYGTFGTQNGLLVTKAAANGVVEGRFGVPEPIVKSRYWDKWVFGNVMERELLEQQVFEYPCNHWGDDTYLLEGLPNQADLKEGEVIRLDSLFYVYEEPEKGKYKALYLGEPGVGQRPKSNYYYGPYP